MPWLHPSNNQSTEPMAVDPELEAIRKKRLEELSKQSSLNPSSTTNQAGSQEQEEQRSNLLIQILDAQARQRLNRICLVKPEKSRFIEDNLIQMVRRGQIRGKINEEQLVQLLDQISQQEQSNQPKITVRFIYFFQFCSSIVGQLMILILISKKMICI